MSLMLIGEYSKKLSDSFKKEYDYIPWREIIDQRNFVVHDYGDLDFTIIWDTINDNILELKDFSAKYYMKNKSETAVPLFFFQ